MEHLEQKELKKTQFPNRIYALAPWPEVPISVIDEAAVALRKGLSSRAALQQQPIFTYLKSFYSSTGVSKKEEKTIKNIEHHYIELLNSQASSYRVALEYFNRSAGNVTSSLWSVKFADLCAATHARSIVSNLERSIQQLPQVPENIIDESMKFDSLLVDTGFEDVTFYDVIKSDTSFLDREHILAKFLLFSTYEYENLWQEVTVPKHDAWMNSMDGDQKGTLFTINNEDFHQILGRLLEMNFLSKKVSLHPQSYDEKNFHLHSMQLQNMINEAAANLSRVSEQVLGALFRNDESGALVRSELNRVFLNRHVDSRILFIILNINTSDTIIEVYKRVRHDLAHGHSDEFLLNFYDLLSTQLEEQKGRLGLLSEEETDEYFSSEADETAAIPDLIIQIRRLYGRLQSKQPGKEIDIDQEQLLLPFIKGAVSAELTIQNEMKKSYLFLSISTQYSLEHSAPPIQVLVSLSDYSTTPVVEWNVLAYPFSPDYSNQVGGLLSFTKQVLERRITEVEKALREDEKKFRAEQRAAKKVKQKPVTWKQQSGISSNDRLIQEASNKKTIETVKRRFFVELPAKEDLEAYQSQFCDKISGKRIAPEVVSLIYDHLTQSNNTGLFSVKKLAGHAETRIRVVIHGTHYRVIVTSSGTDTQYSRYQIQKIFIRNDEDEYKNL